MNSIIKSSVKWSKRDQTSQNCSSCSSIFCQFLSFYTFATLYRGLLVELSWDPTPPAHFLKMIQIPVLELSGTLWLHCVRNLLYSATGVFPQTLISSKPDIFFFPPLEVLLVKCNVSIWNQLHTAFTSYIIYLLSLLTIGIVNVFLIILLLLGYWCFIIWCPILACRVQA